MRNAYKPVSSNLQVLDYFTVLDDSKLIDKLSYCPVNIVESVMSYGQIYTVTSIYLDSEPRILGHMIPDHSNSVCWLNMLKLSSQRERQDKTITILAK